MVETDDKPPGTSSVPPLYRNPVPIDAEKHAGLRMKKDFGVGFCAGTNAIPINAVEMTRIAHHCPIAYTPGEKAMPVAIMGLRENENLFVDGKGEWQHDCYMPAYMRRYPFMFFHSPQTEELVLGIDLADDIIGPSYEHALFNEDRTPSPLILEGLEYCKVYQVAAMQTEEFAAAINENGLLVEHKFEIPTGEQHKIDFAGFRVVDEEKLAALDGSLIREWHGKGWLPYLYANVFSMHKWDHLVEMLMARIAQEQ